MQAETLRKGDHATPAELAARLAVRALGHTAPGEPLRILDPACGAGTLLWAAGEEAARRGRRVLLLGLELNPERVAEAHQRLDALDVPVTITRDDALDPTLAWPAADLILANPPWVSLSGRQAAADPRAALRARSWAPHGWPSLHGAFLARIARHVEETRALAEVLLPASVCEQERYAALRTQVEVCARLREAPEHLGEGLFPGVVEPTAWLSLAPLPGPCAPWIDRNSGTGSDDALIAWLDRFPRLPPESFSDIGVHSGNAASSLVIEPARGLPGLREGRDVRPYQLDPPRRALNINLVRGHGRSFRYGSLERYTDVPVLIRQTAARPIAAPHEPATFFRNSILACEPPPRIDPWFVLGILNSELIARWHQLRTKEANQKVFPQVKVRHLRDLPFPFLRRDEDPEGHDAVAREARALGLGEGSPRDLEAAVHASFAARIAPA